MKSASWCLFSVVFSIRELGKLTCYKVQSLVICFVPSKEWVIPFLQKKPLSYHFFPFVLLFIHVDDFINNNFIVYSPPCK